jgi:hypothetical protein
MESLLDVFFQWAAEQPRGTAVSVHITIVSNALNPPIGEGGQETNVTTYSEGPLYYNPPGRLLHNRLRGATFASTDGGITQYTKIGVFGPNGPTFGDSTAALTITIEAPEIFVGNQSYNMTVKPSSPDSEPFTIILNFDQNTSLFTATNNNEFYTIVVWNINPTLLGR